MSSYQELKQQAAELLRQAEELRADERQRVLSDVKTAVTEWSFTASELGLRGEARKRLKLNAKYRDPDSGKEWCGRGAMPKWLAAHLQAGYAKEQFLIA